MIDMILLMTADIELQRFLSGKLDHFSGRMDLLSPFSHLSVGANGNLGVFVEAGLQHVPVHIGFHPVISVHIADVGTLCYFQSRVSCGGGSAVFPVNSGDILMLPGISVTNPRRIIRRSVIHHDDLKRFVGLTKQAVKASWQIIFYIVGCDDHRY